MIPIIFLYYFDTLFRFEASMMLTRNYAIQSHYEKSLLWMNMHLKAKIRMKRLKWAVRNPTTFLFSRKSIEPVANFWVCVVNWKKMLILFEKSLNTYFDYFVCNVNDAHSIQQLLRSWYVDRPVLASVLCFQKKSKYVMKLHVKYDIAIIYIV